MTAKKQRCNEQLFLCGISYINCLKTKETYATSAVLFIVRQPVQFFKYSQKVDLEICYTTNLFEQFISSAAALVNSFKTNCFVYEI